MTQNDSFERIEHLINSQQIDKQVLANNRQDLTNLIDRLSKAPSSKIDPQLQSLKEQVVKKHQELMEILKTEEKLCREVQKK